ncbi:MAG: DNA-deoxyinosine glycosylase [Betaproteobacteria bacterium HGW-Betaproteobacteria-2]|nr:MAG: DNA-deoxyinosine glycosylase [Betaproteobacteria bacterium HGW-Betaproteobacteria-2]
MKPRITSFAPVANPSAKILILGSIPGEASLAAGQYYAHPRNAFWPIMAEMLGFAPDAPYAERLVALQQADIALWDVLHSCHRKGSLDTAIENDSVEVNDFDGFFAGHPDIRLVCFNGGMTERSYRQHVLKQGRHKALQYVRLPSTSPAHAVLSLQQKIEIWRAAIMQRH